MSTETIFFAYGCDLCADEFTTARERARHRYETHRESFDRRPRPRTNWPLALTLVGMSAWTFFTFAHAAAGVYYVWFAANP